MRRARSLAGFIPETVAVLLLSMACRALAGNPSGSGLPPGYPDRSEALDAFPGFRNPPPGYGEVPFYWWLGDTLTPERILWQMDKLAGRGVTGLQVNYAHSDSGGLLWGLTYPSRPALFSDQWWRLFGWFMSEAKSRGMSVSVSDYTLGHAGQGWFVDEMLRERPEIAGNRLLCDTVRCRAGQEITRPVPGKIVAAKAYRIGRAGAAAVLDLLPAIRSGTLRWKAGAGSWRLALVRVEHVPTSIDPMHPLTGKLFVKHFYQRFEDHFPGEAGKGLNFFFSDELDFGLRGWLWDDNFAAEFKRRKGYDVRPELPALFTYVGPRTPKVRLDYSDVMAALSEEHFFKVVYDWHTSRGMLFGCDHGGRGLDVTEFGDYFRTQRWMTGPGCDQPMLQKDIVKDKVASSIAHLYERPRTWLEGFHSSGWGTSSAQVADAIFANFALGQNLLSLHGLYYSTHGSWWEWAPPDNHWRQPYWADAPLLLRCTERLSYLLSQGYHRCDVAVLYPVAPVEAGMDGEKAVRTAFDAARALSAGGIDFDFLDFQSLERSTIKGGALCVSGEQYRVLVLPAMSAIRFSSISKAQEFSRRGGTVIAVGELPRASDKAGENDPALRSTVGSLFGAKKQRSGVFLKDLSLLLPAVEQATPRDVSIASPGPAPLLMHRRVGWRDVYYLYGAKKGAVCRFRTTGQVELWNPWTGEARPLPVVSWGSGGTVLRLPLDQHEPQVIVFSRGTPVLEQVKKAPVAQRDTVPLDGDWGFTLVPTLDNRWGDFRLPAFDGMMGAEASAVRFTEECGNATGWQFPAFADSSWTRVTPSFGEQFWELGPLPADEETQTLEGALSALDSVSAGQPVVIRGKQYRWRPVEFSWRWGINGDPGRQGYHGLKGLVHDDLTELGNARRDWPGEPSPRYEPDSAGTRYYLWSTVKLDSDRKVQLLHGRIRPSAVWVGHRKLADSDSSIALTSGVNPVLLRYDGVGRTYFVLANGPLAPQQVPLASRWFGSPGVLPFDPHAGATLRPAWYRFDSPPGVQAIVLGVRGRVRVWIDGEEAHLDTVGRDSSLPGPGESQGVRASLSHSVPRPSVVAMRIEPERGFTGGGAIPEPIRFECAQGVVRTGDVSQWEGLRTYSGGMRYTKRFTMSRSSGEVTLDLGDVVSSAEVRVNGDSIGSRISPPYSYLLTGHLREGENTLEVIVYNTLGNHYLATPSRYVGETRSGLIGPVRIMRSYAHE